MSVYSAAGLQHFSEQEQVFVDDQENPATPKFMIQKTKPYETICFHIYSKAVRGESEVHLPDYCTSAAFSGSYSSIYFSPSIKHKHLNALLSHFSNQAHYYSFKTPKGSFYFPSKRRK